MVSDEEIYQICMKNSLVNNKHSAVIVPIYEMMKMARKDEVQICFNKLIKNQIKKIIACSVEEKGRATMVKLSDVLRIINEVS